MYTKVQRLKSQLIPSDKSKKHMKDGKTSSITQPEPLKAIMGLEYHELLLLGPCNSSGWADYFIKCDMIVAYPQESARTLQKEFFFLFWQGSRIFEPPWFEARWFLPDIIQECTPLCLRTFQHTPGTYCRLPIIIYVVHPFIWGWKGMPGVCSRGMFGFS